ncbi:hypothetical protein [Pseudodesulfovibrio sediminis]|uniref:Uncharacterized protein n=1 Tax=Pseudodesulfovibrio sediminis TaxID=2810563 RepID=A0ABM7PA41_9BACT|nr:hypothetical protein [Pseudodesulfovibrio sediminis]BCS90290.1 hypothetical protein PSDVSF_35320 [Pseudodesulfovibrio sediminis]
MHKIFKVLLLGLAAGILDAIPMAFTTVTWQTIIATLINWLGLGIIISYTRYALNSWASGMLIGLITAIPRAILTYPNNPGGILQLLVFALVLGGLLGYTAERLIADQP